MGECRVPAFLFIGGVSRRKAGNRGLLGRLHGHFKRGIIPFISVVARTSYPNKGMCLRAGRDTIRRILRRLTIYRSSVVRRCLRRKEVSLSGMRGTITSHRIFPYCFNSTLRSRNIRRLLSKLSLCVGSGACPTRFKTGICGVTESGRKGHLACLGIANKELGMGSMIRKLGRGVGRVQVCSNRGFRTIRRMRTKEMYTIAKLRSAEPKRKVKTRRRSSLPMLRPILACRVLLPSSYSMRGVLLGLGVLRRRRPRLRVM